jgi:ubiquitin-protein ligase/uncharacterized membrane protein YgcG
MSATKRLLRDYKQLTKQPIVGASACPTDDMHIWHANVGVPLTIGGETKIAPMHAVLVFKADYPNSAPNAGFCTDFAYTFGAAYMGKIDRDGPHLVSKKIVCLNVLGNFADVHDEWADQQGSGWSPAYTVSTLLVSLQAILLELDSRLSPDEKKSMYSAAMAYQCVVIDDEVHRGESPYPALADGTTVGTETEKAIVPLPPVPPIAVAAPPPVPAAPEAPTAPTPPVPLSNLLMQDVYAFAAQNTLTPTATQLFIGLLQRASHEGRTGGGGAETTPHQPSEPAPTAPTVPEEPSIDETITCYMTGAHCGEDTLGYGIVIDRKLLKTAAEILSWEAFHTNGLRMTSMKAPFTHFLPAFLSRAHVEHSDWKTRMQKSLSAIAKPFDGSSAAINVVVGVLPCLINSMVVEIMRNEKAGAISFFEALCSFWRSLQWYIETVPAIRGAVKLQLEKFVAQPKHRHKNVVPDVGQLLALSTVMSCGSDVGYSPEAFVDAYLDESFVRCVMWWEKAGVSADNAPDVFQATEVSRNICLFTLLVRKHVLGGGSAVQEAADAMDRTHGKVPDRLATLQAEWKAYQQKPAKSWLQFAKHTHCTAEMATRISAGAPWIADCVKQARSNGKKYGYGGGGGKGGGGGYGKGGGGGYGKGGGGGGGYGKGNRH